MKSLNLSLWKPLAPLAVLAWASCEPPGENCTLEAVAGLNVTVVDAGGEPVCDAEVTARDGDFEEVLQAQGCTFFGAFERAGTYEITARRPGEIAVASGVVVEQDVCHVVPAEAELTLEAVGCTEEVVPGLEITVFDNGGARVCDAILSAENEVGIERFLEPAGDALSCVYLGAFEEAGTWTVTASRGGFELETLADLEVALDFDGCHVETVVRDITFDQPVEACTASIEDGLRVTVTMAGACAATVTATDGAFSEVLEETGTECVFQGLEERPGRYDVRVEAPGLDPVVEEVIIHSSGCHPILEERSYGLE